MAVQQKRSTAVDLTCLGSEPSPLFWYHNGRAALSQRSSGASSILHIPKLDDSSTGVYQCVQRDSDKVTKMEQIHCNVFVLEFIRGV
ncbi:unnamed protein product [Dicrocoelium dendriticum]|nr:unnamed protein product [Dicrocoelium dendriticum]